MNQEQAVQSSLPADAEFQDIRDLEFSQDDFLNTTLPYELVYRCKDDPFRHDRQLAIMCAKAAKVGIRNFKTLYSKYTLSLKRTVTDIYICNMTQFEGQPIELDAGTWNCDERGVMRWNGSKEEVACCHPILPVERLVNIDTGVEKLKISYSKGKKWRDVIADKRTLASANSIVSLADMGVAVNSENARSLVQYISDVENLNYDRIPERKSVGRLGHIEGEGFSPYVDGLIFDGDANYRTMFQAISSHGSFDEWQKTARECRNMSVTARIMLSAAFASVLIQPLGLLPFFVHLWGVDSGTGKTVALMLAASVWGDPQIGRYIQTFNSTMVGQEKMAAFLNSIPFLIDELQLARDGRGKSQFNVYALAQGVGRTRGNKSGGVDRTPTWGNCILTTGESPLTNLSDGAGAVNRVIDIECRADEKVIEDGMRISAALKKHYGFAGRTFVKILSQEQHVAEVAKMYHGVFRLLSKSDTTEKQAMAAAAIVTADVFSSLWIFQDENFLTVPQIAEFLQSKAAVSAGERGYRYMCDWVAQNSTRLQPDVENGDTYGLIEGDWAYIIYSVFRKATEDAGFSSAALLSHMKQKGLIQTRQKNNTRGKRINGVLTECVVMRIAPLEEEEPDFQNL